MSGGRFRTAGVVASYLLIAVIICIALQRLAASITAAHLLDEAQQQRARAEANQPLWQWRLRKPRDLVAGRAFGNAEVNAGHDGLTITSRDGTPFELGLPVAWAVDLKHWPILLLQLHSSAPGVLGVVWQGDNHAACLSTMAIMLTTDARNLRIDLRGLAWESAGHDACAEPGTASMLRLRVRLPPHATLHLASVTLLTTEPILSRHDAPIDLPQAVSPQGIAQAAVQARDRAMPLFRLPAHASAETMLAWRDHLRNRWPAALIVPASLGYPSSLTPAATTTVEWVIASAYLMALVWLALRPARGPWRPWLEVAGCLLGPLWLIAGLHWGMRPTPLGVLAFGAGLGFAVAIERHHLPRLWRLPPNGRDWLWPLAMVPVTVALILGWGHGLRSLPIGHLLAYFGWAWLQQWLMLAVLLRRFEQMLPRICAIVPTAFVFALLHTPNGVLMQLCFVGELYWAGCFLRSRSIPPIALAHAACALLAESGLVGGWLRSLEVSARFFL